MYSNLCHLKNTTPTNLPQIYSYYMTYLGIYLSRSIFYDIFICWAFK